MPQKNTTGGTDVLWPAITDYQREVLGFISMRLSKDADLFKQLQECRSWEEVSLMQSKWMQTTLTDYAREAANVMKITTKQVEGGATGNLRLVA